MDNCFPAIVGNDKLKRRLATEIREGRFPHAYILAGKDGSGKMTLAMQIAAVKKDIARIKTIIREKETNI